MALLGAVEILVFTGGIGQHSDSIRSAATGGLERLGLTRQNSDCPDTGRATDRAPRPRDDEQKSFIRLILPTSEAFDQTE